MNCIVLCTVSHFVYSRHLFAVNKYRVYVCVYVCMYVYIIAVQGIADTFDAHACVCEMLLAAELETRTLQPVVFFDTDVRSGGDLPLCKGSSWASLHRELYGSH